MRKRRKKVILVTGIVFTIMVVGIVGVVLLDRQKEEPQIKELRVELGGKLTNNIKDYLENKDFRYDEYELSNSEYKDKVGKYSYIVSKKKRSVLDKVLKKKTIYYGNIYVVDTVSPVLEVKDIEIKQGEEINLNSFVESCIDLSECSISSPDESKLTEMQSKVGEYDLNIVGADKYGNTVQKKVHLKVNEVPKVEVKKEVSSVGKGNGIAVLNYHFTISDEEKSSCSPSSICMNENLFDEHLKYIKENGFYTATLKELEDYLDGYIDLPKKSVVITIDDGWFVSRAISKLEKYDLHGVLFLIGSLAPVTDYASKNLEIASHTWNLHGAYGSLVNASFDTIIEDLSQSKSSLNGTPYFCYPFYQYDNHVIEALKQTGFTMAFAGGGVKARRGVDKYKVPRFVVGGNDSVATLASYIN